MARAHISAPFAHCLQTSFRLGLGVEKLEGDQVGFLILGRPQDATGLFPGSPGMPGHEGTSWTVGQAEQSPCVGSWRKRAHSP
jgi:hypothetical protein